MQRRNWLWVLIGIVVAIGLGATAISTFYTNMLWFREVGFLSVFTKIISARVAIAVLGGLFFFLITLLSLVAVMWRRRDFTVVGGLVMPIPITIPRSYRRYLALPALVVGVLGGVAAYSQWHVVLAYLNQIPFGTADPFFAKDVGFYIFTLPFYRLLQQHLWVAFLSSLAVSAFVYFILGDIRFAPRRIAVERRARIHLSVLAAILFALKFWGYQIST